MPSGSSNSLSPHRLEALLFAGVLYGREEHYEAALRRLARRFGPPMKETAPSRWESDYYADELGSPILRRFLFFKRIIQQPEIVEVKLETIGLERQMSRGRRRTVNIDPGYMNLNRVVLPTTKDYSHRIYLGKGIFAEVELIYKHGTFRKGLFVYHDYEWPETIELFNGMREVFKGLLSGGGCGG